MLMTACLNEQQCAIMREFFALLLKIKQLDVRNKGVAVSAAFEIWSRDNPDRKMPVKAYYTRPESNKLAWRRKWLKSNPNATTEDMAKAWGLTWGGAYSWCLAERRKIGAN